MSSLSSLIIRPQSIKYVDDRGRSPSLWIDQNLHEGANGPGSLGLAGRSVLRTEPLLSLL